ncbi:unnamed protein product [Callosobruchus maculatus]|uniref:Uncharacterized protein n=1 Tax=Callosobruchus maculatus TaxID=64391 RepID=A0A653BJ63_CALMS|nr:unnamed protein product [Callosobruchus maculatus]
MSTSKSTSEDLQTADPNKESPPTYFSKENVAEPINSNIAKGSSHRPHESRSEANRKPKCTKCRKAINVPIGGKVSQRTTEKSASEFTQPPATKKPCHKCKKKSSTYRCPKKTSKKAFEVQASSRSIKQHVSNAIIKCTTALKEKLSSKDRLDDYILLDGPIYIRKNCLDVNGGTCRGTCCSSGEEIEVEPEPVPEELTEEQRFQECRKCCFQMKCAEKKICDNDMDFIVAKYEQFYLSNQTESKYGIDKADSDLSGKPVTGLSKTHGETPGDYKYHFLMTDAACSAPPDGQDADDVVMTANSRPVSPKPHPAVRISNTSGEIPTFYYAQDTSTEAMPKQSLSVAADDEESTSSILIGKLDPDEQAEEEKEQEEEPAQGDVSEGKTDASENESDNKYDDEEYRRDSKVSWGGESSHRATMDTTYSDDDRDDKASHVRISEDPKRDPLGWSNQSVDRTTNKKSASFVKKSLVGSPLEMEQTPPPAPPPKKKFCSFFRRRNKSEKAEKTNKSRSQTFAKDPDSSESSEISFEESRRNSNRSRASE